MFGIKPMRHSVNLIEQCQTVFGGRVHRAAAGDGVIFDDWNVCADRYPALTVRPRRNVHATVQKSNGLFARDGLFWVDGGDLVADGQTVAQLTDGPKMMCGMERQMEEALRTFGEKASLEMRLKNRNARRRVMDREETAIARETDRAELDRKRQELADDREALRELNEAERDRLRLERAENDRRNAAERRRLAEERAARRRKHQEAVRKKELRELQEKTLKALQWISKNRRKAPETMQAAFSEVLGNIDLYAISMADEMNWSSKYGATWKDLKQMYLHAQESDPNFMPSEDLDRIVKRLDSVQLESMDFDQLRDLYQAAVGLRTEFYQRNNVIGSEEHEIMEELYSECVEEMRTAPKKLNGMLDRFLNLEQLTPMNVFEEMGGFNPDGALYKFAQQLEAGERKVRSFKVRSKADLKGLEGDALKVRLNHVLKGCGVELELQVRETLAELYEAGYTEVVPSAAPDSVTVDGVELELDGRMRKEYDKARGGIIERELPEITGSAFFAQADEKTRKAMVTKLYNYAAEKAKESVLEDYALGTTTQVIDEIVRSGGSAADYAVFDAATVNMAAWQRAEVLREWGADEAVTGLMFKHLVSKSWGKEQAELQKVGVDVGQFLELYAMHGQIDTQDLDATAKATNFAYWLDGQRYTDKQKAVIKDQMAYFQMMPSDAGQYNAATAAGLDREQALELTEELDALEPPEGKTSVQEIQKYRVAIDQSVSESNQLKMLAAAGLKDSSYDKVAKGYEMGVAPAAWVRVKEVQQQFDTNGNGSMTQAEWEAAIEGICSYRIVLPGDNPRFNLTNEQKGVLWQMMVGKNTKSKNNPFSPKAGQRWRELMGYE